MSSKLVERRLNDFKRRCGKDGDAALQLAYHAAMPVALNPELLHFLRINFFLDPPEQLSHTVEFEFLTSGLCREIDAELYEIEPEIRNELLQELMRREDARQRIQDIATLLWQYVEYHSPWADRVELERAQQLTALNFLDPAKAKEWLDEAEANPSLGKGEREWFIAMRQEIEETVSNKSKEQRAIPNNSDREIFTELLRRSGLAEYSARKALCIKIGIDPNRLAFVRESTNTDFVLQLINYLNEIGDKEALYKILSELEVVFKGSKYLANLENMKSKLFEKEQSEQDDLSSDTGVNYTRLRDLLAAGKWKEADQETLAVMLKASGREKDGWLDIESINNFPCTDLRTIDQLWVKYSNGRFGFSVQKRIWESVGGKPDAGYEIWEKFGDRVGWRRRRMSAMLQQEWLNYDQMNFTTQAKEGHLPNIIISPFNIAEHRAKYEQYGEYISITSDMTSIYLSEKKSQAIFLFSRVQTCEL
jgi:hypothetical protein